MIPDQQVTSVKIAAEKRELTRKEVYELQNSIRQTLIQALSGTVQALGGVALLFGLYYTAQTLRISQETLRTNQEALQVTQEGQMTERFAQRLSIWETEESMMIRLGGIHALQRIARHSDQDHWPIMESYGLRTGQRAMAAEGSPPTNRWSSPRCSITRNAYSHTVDGRRPNVLEDTYRHPGSSDSYCTAHPVPQREGVNRLDLA